MLDVSGFYDLENFPGDKRESIQFPEEILSQEDGLRVFGIDIENYPDPLDDIIGDSGDAYPYRLLTLVVDINKGLIEADPEIPLSGVFPNETSVQLTASPEALFDFSEWTGDVPEGHETDNPLTIVMDDDKTITAVFVDE